MARARAQPAALGGHKGRPDQRAPTRAGGVAASTCRPATTRAARSRRKCGRRSSPAGASISGAGSSAANWRLAVGSQWEWASEWPRASRHSAAIWAPDDVDSFASRRPTGGIAHDGRRRRKSTSRRANWPPVKCSPRAQFVRPPEPNYRARMSADRRDRRDRREADRPLSTGRAPKWLPAARAPCKCAGRQPARFNHGRADG